MLRSVTLLALAAACTLGTAHAQSRPGGIVRPFLGAGLTFGGDTLESFEYEDGTDAKVRAGGIIHLQAGVDVQVSGPFSVQASYGFHVDDASADNGDYKFTRKPAELLGFYMLSDRFRLGVGARKSQGAKVKSSGVVSGLNADFDSNTGFVVEGEYFMGEHFSVRGRVVSEKFKGRNGVYRGQELDGTHAGVYLSGYFF